MPQVKAEPCDNEAANDPEFTSDIDTGAIRRLQRNLRTHRTTERDAHYPNKPHAPRYTLHCLIR